MGFACENELEIEGSSADERRRAADLAPALDCVDEASVSGGESGGRIVLRFASEDGVPEEGVAALEAQFPGLSFLLVYYSRDGGFYGYFRTGPGGSSADSEDIEAEAPAEGGGFEAPLLYERFGGDGIRLARDRFGL